MKADPNKEQREACYYILDYLVDNPDAGDSLEGIVDWWLLTQKIKFETQTVSAAVAELVADGLIVEQEGSDSRVVYRVNRAGQSMQKIKAMLSEIKTSLTD